MQPSRKRQVMIQTSGKKAHNTLRTLIPALNPQKNQDLIVQAFSTIADYLKTHKHLVNSNALYTLKCITTALNTQANKGLILNTLNAIIEFYRNQDTGNNAKEDVEWQLFENIKTLMAAYPEPLNVNETFSCFVIPKLTDMASFFAETLMGYGHHQKKQTSGQKQTPPTTEALKLLDGDFSTIFIALYTVPTAILKADITLQTAFIKKLVSLKTDEQNPRQKALKHAFSIMATAMETKDIERELTVFFPSTQ